MGNNIIPMQRAQLDKDIEFLEIHINNLEQQMESLAKRHQKLVEAKKSCEKARDKLDT